MTLPAIHTLVPHADPMVLLDRVTAVDAESLSAEVTITRQSMFFDEKEQGIGAWVGIEYMAQAIAAYAGYQAISQGEKVRVGFLLGSRRYESQCAHFGLGSILHVKVQRVVQHENGLGAFECQIGDTSDTESKVLATATVTVFQPDNVNNFLKDTSHEGKL